MIHDISHIDTLTALVEDAVAMRKSLPTGCPEWFTEDGRRAGLQTALNIITEEEEQ